MFNEILLIVSPRKTVSFIDRMVILILVENNYVSPVLKKTLFFFLQKSVHGHGQKKNWIKTCADNNFAPPYKIGKII